MVNLNLKIPETFLNDEERSGYFVEKKKKELWAVELDLLKELDRVCKENDITYYMMFGSLLGAVRHKGFIPWDDDIDVCMDRENFNKLVKLNKEFKEPYFLQTEDLDKGCHTFYAKLRNSNTAAILKPEIEYGYRYNRGIFIDIFILDSMPNEKEEQDSYKIELRKKMNDSFRFARMFDSKSFHSVHKYAYILVPFMKIGKFVINLFSIPNVSLKKFDKLARRYADKDTLYYSEVGDGEDAVFKKEWFKETIDLDFEFLKVPCPKSYDEILKTSYGDYMKFVIGTEAHTMEIIDTDKSYKKYDQ